MMTPEAIIEIVQAFIDGKKIQFCHIGDFDIENPTRNVWKILNAPSWDFSSFYYRVKPDIEPIKVYKWAYIYEDSKFVSISSFYYETIEDASLNLKAHTDEVLGPIRGSEILVIKEHGKRIYFLNDGIKH